VTAIGIDGLLEGNRAHSIFPDDIETDVNTKTMEAREYLNDRVGEFKDILYPDIAGKVGEICFIGTPHNEDSIYWKLNERNYVFRTWPIAYPQLGDRVMNLSPLLKDRLENGTALYTEDGQYQDNGANVRYSRMAIIDKMAEGRRRFSMQHMLIADLGDTMRYPLRIEDLVVFAPDRDIAPIRVAWGKTNHTGLSTAMEDIPSIALGNDRCYAPIFFDKRVERYTSTKAYIDPAGRGEDETGVTIIGHLNGYLFVKHCSGYQGGSSEEALSKLAALCRLHGARDIYVEDNMGRGMFQQLFEPILRRYFLKPKQDPTYPMGWAAAVHDDNATGMKEERIIDTLEPVMSTHRLIMTPEAMIPNPEHKTEYELQYQLSRITRERKCLLHDDRIDSLAGCVKVWMDVLRLDPARQADRAEEEAINREIADHDREWAAMLRHKKEPSYLTGRGS